MDVGIFAAAKDVFNIIWTVGAGAVGWVLWLYNGLRGEVKSLHAIISEQDKALQQHQVTLFREYYSKPDVDRLINEIKAEGIETRKEFINICHRIEDKLDSLIMNKKAK